MLNLPNLELDLCFQPRRFLSLQDLDYLGSTSMFKTDDAYLKRSLCQD